MGVLVSTDCSCNERIIILPTLNQVKVRAIILRHTLSTLNINYRTVFAEGNLMELGLTGEKNRNDFHENLAQMKLLRTAQVQDQCWSVRLFMFLDITGVS
jgi:hypothetical protein